jgi:hypothetical protein
MATSILFPIVPSIEEEYVYQQTTYKWGGSKWSKLRSNSATDHTVLSNIGANSHAQLDKALIRTGGKLPTTVTEILDVFTIDFSVNNNFLLNANGAYSIAAIISAENVGQSGIIKIVNATGTTPAALPANLLTSNGLLIDWAVLANDVSILSYYVVNTTQAVVNYIGKFS